ncbi:MAG TPA: DNA oxidative demethylase AlkB [Stellaceae bacterium]|nr:DNA oxidative demethylase AlkB [Stellaceae bacterium]
MSTIPGAAAADLLPGTLAEAEVLAPGALLLHGFARDEAAALVAMVAEIAAAAPFRQMVTPGGYRMSVAMTNCGDAGWVTDRRGYHYAPLDPLTAQAWPIMPEIFRDLAERAAEAAGFDEFTPDACLINRYEPGARLSLHQDKDERDAAAPIVSVSLGLPAIFLWGGLRRNDRPRRILMENGDVAVWGGPARFTYHGIAPLADGEHPFTGRARVNLTLRKAL